MLGAGNAGAERRGRRGCAEDAEKYRKYCLDIFGVFCGVFALILSAGRGFPPARE